MRDRDLELVEGIEDIGRKISYERWLVGSRINITSGVVIIAVFIGSLFIPGLWDNVSEGWRLFCMLWPSGIGLLYLGIGISQRRGTLQRIRYEKLHGTTGRKNPNPSHESW